MKQEGDFWDNFVQQMKKENTFILGKSINKFNWENKFPEFIANKLDIKKKELRRVFKFLNWYWY